MNTYGKMIMAGEKLDRSIQPRSYDSPRGAVGYEPDVLQAIRDARDILNLVIDDRDETILTNERQSEVLDILDKFLNTHGL